MLHTTEFKSALILTLAAAFSVCAADTDGDKFFEMKVRPILAERCVGCHGPEKKKGGLRLDSLEAALKGGETSPALVKNDPAKSLMITAVEYKDEDLQMPPKKADQLSAADVETLKQWIAMGAPWPASKGPAMAKKQRVITDDDRAFWSFQPLKDVAPPDVADKGWTRTPIDRFVFQKLAAEGLTPAPEAEKRSLIRRTTFDLHGLPPTPEEIEAFVNDTAPDAYDKLIDRLLASPRYGERWARHWLDLARYAESDGFRQDAFRPHAWPYRDYVIRSFNEDKPYDRFVQEQLAGDELAPDDPNVFVATAFLRHGLYEYNQVDVPAQWNEMLTDVTDTTADVFLGLSMGCARCHDHKFDPILQADYFNLRSFFGAMYPRSDAVLATPKQKADFAAAQKTWEEKTADIRAKMAEIEKPFAEKGTKEALKRFIPEFQAIFNKPAAERTIQEQQYYELIWRQVDDKYRSIDGKIKGKERDAWTALKRQLAEFDNLQPKPLPVAFITTDIGPEAAPILIPGDTTKKAHNPDYLTVLKQAPESSLVKSGFSMDVKIEKRADSSGRRTALAKWLTQPTHPLTTRVIVNRVWQYHFGRGLVATSSDYGRLGEKPTHPELLDYLARDFVKNGWSIKRLHKQIMLSAAYRQTSQRAMPPVAKLKDPENRYLWRFSTRRLDAEQIRDAMLATSGELNLDAGGAPVDSGTPRRTVFTKQIRNTRDPFIESFDAPDAFSSSATRNSTTTPTQSLLMINGQMPLQRAEAFAARLQKSGGTPEQKIAKAYALAFGREPIRLELENALKFLSGASADDKPAVAVTAPAGTPGSARDSSETRLMPIRGSQALYVREGNPADILRAPAQPPLPENDFTIEAVILLESIYEDASVRTIASQWNSDAKKGGWSFGVTSAKSKHEPRNLILQIVADGTGYEVLPSDLRVELHKPYYVGATVRLNETDSTVTFYIKDLSDNEAVLRAATVKPKAKSGIKSTFAFAIGGRDAAPGFHAHGWDGLIDDLRLTSAVLKKEELLVNDAEAHQQLQAEYHFEADPGVLKDSSKYQRHTTKTAVTVKKETTPGTGKPSAALIDFCHVLLNASEFLYVD